jgi:SAM-dependent methyltransferase
MGLKAILKRLIWLAAQVPLLLPAVITFYELKPNKCGWRRKHPYDRVHGVRTSGVVPGFAITPGDPMDAPTNVGYGAAQPSIIRTALAAIPDPQHCHFLDLGCGKGRPLLIATEFGFHAIMGFELSPTLSRIARRNANVFSRTHPDRTRIDIVTGDALVHKLPAGKLTVFLYHPFDRPSMEQLLRNIEASLDTTPHDLYIVYYNPVWADVLDTSTTLERRYAAQIPYAADEIGYGPNESDAVVIWQNRGNPNPRPPGIATAFVTIVSPGWRAEITGET